MKDFASLININYDFLVIGVYIFQPSSRIMYVKSQYLKDYKIFIQSFRLDISKA